MKRWMMQLMAMVLVLSALAIPAFAAGFTDADGDGICDNKDQNCGYVDANQDGICDNRKNGPCHLWIDDEGRPCQGLRIRGGNFTDADEDGICDHRGEGRGYGRQWRKNR